MEINDKIDLINTLHPKMVDAETDGETCYYVQVVLDDETRDVLKQLGVSEETIKELTDEGDIDHAPVIDIAPIGFEFAHWWTQQDGFMNSIPAEEGGTPDD